MISADDVKQYFSQKPVVQHYSEAANSVGLWESEERIFQRVFPDHNTSLLELGCGAGRIAFGLWESGYRKIMATDVSSAMVRETRRIAQVLEYGIFTQTADATRLPFEPDAFEGAIFGFNGLMQIPDREKRRQAMRETCRVLVPGSFFVFTSHDRESSNRQKFWKRERELWKKNQQDPRLVDFGDLYYETPEGGWMFIHAPTPQEVRDDLETCGFRVEATCLRSSVAVESERVRNFSDECRFWVAQKL